MRDFSSSILNQMDVVFFVYGLSFFGLGLVILAQPKEEGRYEISQSIWLLAFFSLIHGALEWLDLWKIVRGDSSALSLMKDVFLFVSYIFLFEYGRRLTRSICEKIPSVPNLVTKMLGAPIYCLVAFGFLFELLMIPDKTLAMTIASRYFLGFIGSSLTGIGFLLCINKKLPQQAEKSALSWPVKYIVLAAVSFILYGMLGGLVVPPANVIPANVINDSWFFATFHLPVQLFRAACAVLAAIAVGNIFRVFHLEVWERLLFSLRLSKKSEAELRIAAIAFDVQEGILITDANSVILRVNHAFINITGYNAVEAIGKSPRILQSGSHDKAFYAAMWESIRSAGNWEGEIWNRRKNGETYPGHLTITAVKGTDGIVSNYVATFIDITKERASEAEVWNLAFYDTLTGLPNRRLLMDRLQQAFASSVRSGRKGALLFIDLDHFKNINDTLGHSIGDLLLQRVAERLTACVREGDTVARLGGDEFVVILENMSEQPIEAAAQTTVIGEKILAKLSQPYQLALHEHYSTSSIGAAIFGDHDKSQEELLKQADIAMYQAKNAGRNTLRFFDPQTQNIINARAALEDELHKALEKKQFQMYYQIQVDGSFHPLGAEALIRWIHPERGMVLPAQFIPLAEEVGLILPIGQWVLETACAQLKAWQQDALTLDLVLAVNVSAKQFRQADFMTKVQATVQHYAINPMRLKLELTESMLLENIEHIITTMIALKEIGIQFSLDDFGTGYSSLQYLKKLPLNQLKIDQSFVRDIVTDSNDQAIAHTIIAMAQSLNLEVIAEGVETEEQRQLLLSKGCTQYQGYLFGKPVPIEQFEALLRHS